ncbi:MAG: DUF1232 domain-containing protein [Verrucomicrobiaceae bacterium]|nr:DUF1232 domain-containing protein [Verrucomicrobiaceae bacterium]
MKVETELNEETFWDTIVRYAAKLGREIVELALQLFYALQDPDTPAWAKSVIIGALVYLVSPIDAIPDVIPGIGLTDDVAVITAAVAAVAMHIKPEHKQEATKTAASWFD